MNGTTEKYVRNLIRECLDELYVAKTDENIVDLATYKLLTETKAGEETSANLRSKKVKRVNNKSGRGVPFYTFGATKRMLSSYTNKIEEHIADDFKAFVFTKNVKIEHVRGEVMVYTDNKQILTVNINPDRLRPSFVRFDFCKPKLKIKIPMNVVPNTISMIIHNYRHLFEEYGILNLLKF